MKNNDVMYTTDQRAKIEMEMYRARDLVELAQSDHPEDYNLTVIHEILEQIIMEVE